MQPAQIRPAQPVVPVKRRWYAPDQKHEERETPPAQEITPETVRDSDDDHIDEYAR